MSDLTQRTRGQARAFKAVDLDRLRTADARLGRSVRRTTHLVDRLLRDGGIDVARPSRARQRPDEETR